MTDVTVFGFPQSTYVRTARICLEEKGVEYELAEANPGDAEQAARHPFGKIPAFRHGDVQLFESTAIGHYVDAVFDGPALRPTDPVAFARMVQWNSAIVDYVYPALIPPIVIERVAPALLGRDTNEDRIAAALPDAERHLGILDEALADREWLAGDSPTLADFMLAPIAAYIRMMPDTIALFSARAHLGRWFGAVSDRASFAATVPPLPE